MREIGADIDATIANIEALGIPAGVARTLVDQMVRYDMDLSAAPGMAQMALRARDINAMSWDDSIGVVDVLYRSLNGAAAFRARMMEMTTEAEGGDYA